MKTKYLTFKLLKLFQLAEIFTEEKHQTQNKKKLSSETTFETFNQPILSLKYFQFRELSNKSMNLQIETDRCRYK